MGIKKPPLSRIAKALFKADAMHGVQEIIKYRFQNRALLWTALQAHRSPNFPDRNEDLAQIGDAIVRLIALNAARNRGIGICE